MKEKILIVEDEFIVANDLRLVLENAGYNVCGIAASVEEAEKIIKEQDVQLVLLDIRLQGKRTGIDLAKQLKVENIAFVYLSANSNEATLEAAKATEPYGFLVKPFREKDLLVTLEIARYRHEHSKETHLRKEAILKEKLSAIVANQGSWDDRLLDICRAFQQYVPFDYISVGFNTINDVTCNDLSFLRIGYDEYQVIGVPELLTISGIKMDELTAHINNTSYDVMPAMLVGETFEQTSREPSLNQLFSKIFQIKSTISLPLRFSNDRVFYLCFYSRKADAYKADHVELLLRLQKSITAAIESVLNESKQEAINTLKKKDSSRAPGDLLKTPEFDEIIGTSHLLLNVFDLVSQVAPTDTSVLILGESGTGKERIANCIHNLSARKNRALIKINCAALPAPLIESELFGHEKGAFTGAMDKKIGKFELASCGTIFLDEIGELPLDQQVKLLRVLQEKEIERLGGRSPIKVDVRVIAATNRNLEKEVAEGRFRLDLYYRLNVFPIELPSLRERTEDIEQLANHFAKRFCQKMGKQYHGISHKMLTELETYPWPGNIRELENIIEQSVILNDGKSGLTLKRSLQNAFTPSDESAGRTDGSSKVRSLGDIKHLQQESEKEYIISILKKAKGRIRGNGGAAELLGQKPTTLESRIAKLGIKKEDLF